MQRLVASTLIVLAATLPADAKMRRHHAGDVHRGSAEAGMPITAEPGSIRINAVGQVISQPVPVIEKERAFNSRAQHELSKPLPPADQAPLGTQQPPAAPQP